MPVVNVFGLTMSAVMEARIIAAARGAYPDLTAGASDDRAIQLVLRQWITDLLATHERNTATLDPGELARQAANAAAATRQAAYNQAVADAAAGIQVSAAT